MVKRAKKKVVKKRRISKPRAQAFAAEIFDTDRSSSTEKYWAKSAWDGLSPGGEAAAHAFGERYRKSLANKHTRMRVDFICKKLERHGYLRVGSLEDSLGDQWDPVGGKQKFFGVKDEQMVYAIHLGSRPGEHGMHVAGAHIDSPALIATEHPLRQNFNQAFMQSMVYGGVNPADFTNIPLCMYLVGAMRDKDNLEADRAILLGGRAGGSSFIAPTQSLHFDAESPDISELYVLLGNKPYPSLDVDVRKRILLQSIASLRERTGMQLTEQSFEDLDVWFFPAAPANYADLSKSVITAYGQDNWASAYALLEGLIDTKNPSYTNVAVWYAGEEIDDSGPGSISNNFLADVVTPAITYILKEDLASHYAGLINGWTMFLDGIGPASQNTKGHQDMHNAAYMGSGPVLLKHGGSEGLYGGYSSHPAHRKAIRDLLRDSNVPHQVAMMGSQDNRIPNASSTFHTSLGAWGVDLGPIVSCMHKGMEESSVVDVHLTAQAVKAFYGVKDHSDYHIGRE
ncbi:MAG: hypothetical protein QF486_02775 [Candidatus Woesearchaeota archaeon]|jgi:aspartyl aminopeptidase|nr:hypothetical protein [Candidatus Woesearchaeota archaeon]MDP7198520.1 hypothetical protein [Candidatus Woesearchaeota archaeon]MDP7466738.1 hypothetical protein [Candidatus Woesearchaeota archaeon]MDP7647963.1 hypothetical protein [Candidatus Woesearchaeota archaeon]